MDGKIVEKVWSGALAQRKRFSPSPGFSSARNVVATHVD